MNFVSVSVRMFRESISKFSWVGGWVRSFHLSRPRGRFLVGSSTLGLRLGSLVSGWFLVSEACGMLGLGGVTGSRRVFRWLRVGWLWVAAAWGWEGSVGRCGDGREEEDEAGFRGALGGGKVAAVRVCVVEATVREAMMRRRRIR